MEEKQESIFPSGAITFFVLFLILGFILWFALYFVVIGRALHGYS